MHWNLLLQQETREHHGILDWEPDKFSRHARQRRASTRVGRWLLVVPVGGLAYLWWRKDVRHRAVTTAG